MHLTASQTFQKVWGSQNPLIPHLSSLKFMTKQAISTLDVVPPTLKLAYPGSVLHWSFFQHAIEQRNCPACYIRQKGMDTVTETSSGGLRKISAVAFTVTYLLKAWFPDCKLTILISPLFSLCHIPQPLGGWASERTTLLYDDNS